MIETVTIVNQPVKLGVVFLGSVCGKNKYTLLEEEDIEFARQYALEAVLKVDRDGTGAAIYVQGRKPGDAASEYFHELLWIHRYHYIQPGCRVVHKNGISVDNRVANLEMVEIDVTTDAPAPRTFSPDELESRRRGGELYRLALSELPSFSGQLERYQKAINADGDEDEAEVTVFECRNAACCTLEHSGLAFLVCSVCSNARYCSQSCMDADSRCHEKECETSVDLSRQRGHSAAPLSSR